MKIIKHTILDKVGRLDKFLKDFMETEYSFSRSYIQKLISDNNILVNDNIVSSNYNLLENDEITINIPDPELLDAKPQEIDFEIVYEDSDFLIVNKPNNLVVHPGAGNYENTLVNGLLYKIKDLSSIGGILRPGIVHRLDKMTTGLMIVAKHDLVHQRLTEMLATNKIYKEYIGIVHGVIEHKKGKINAPIGRSKSDRKKMTVTDKNSKKAVTNFEVIKTMENHSLVSFIIETGRTHQIRVHMAYIKHPILGDPIYSIKEDMKLEFGQYLHSHKLEFTHPITNKKMFFIAPTPTEFNDKLKELEG